MDFFPIFNWIFLPALACKIQVRNQLKIKFIKLDISNWRIAKIKCRFGITTVFYQFSISLYDVCIPTGKTIDSHA
jgi:hypothetical protein